MYEQFYGFSARPFQLTPDPRFWFESATHRTAMSYLGYGLAQGEGFIVITGEVGSGKTTLVGHVMESIDPARLTAARLVSTQVADADLLRLVADAFGVAIASPAKSDALAAIETFLHEEARAGRRVLLIVDEAQNLAVSALEELRMLSNFQLGETSLLQIFLLAQPEFRATLASPQLEQLRQRVIATHHLEAMLPEEVEPYLIHRLSLVGWREDPAFAPSTYDELWKASAGIPRRVNTIASRLLLYGAVEELHELSGEDVRSVVADMGLSPAELVEAPAPRAVAPAPAVVAEAAPESAPEAAAVNAPEAEAAAEEAPAPGFTVADFSQPPVMMVPPAPASPEPAFANDEEVDALRAQLAALEARCDEQDAAIRRILGLLIQWVEQDEAEVRALHGRAA
jgi:general secretion pathway protein A